MSKQMPTDIASPAKRHSRRGFLGHVAGAYLAVGAATLTPVAADPVFAAIRSHTAARARLNDMDSEDAGWDVALDEESALWGAFCACRPTTHKGLAAYAAHAAAYPDLWVLSGEDGPARIIMNISAAVSGLGRAEG